MSALGTEYKYGIKLPPIDGIHLSEMDFEVTTYVYSNKSVTFKKSDEKHIKMINEDSYKVIVDSESAIKIGKGKVLAKLTIHIPDLDFEDGFRTEIYDDLCTYQVIT